MSDTLARGPATPTRVRALPADLARGARRRPVTVTAVALTLAVVAYDPGRGIMARRGGPAGDNS